ncbi:MAG: mechanosensitive ion channel family protein [Prevotellaceae bacterium]|nr:mechanosensitive ion channel family protein [Prevotellaceae bacterium]
MKRLTIFLLLCMLASMHSWAVLKEKDLARTLGVLRAELAADYEQQQQIIASYEEKAQSQHEQLVSYMTQCEQIGLMLYSQSTENIFDMAYACQQATSLYRQLQKRQTSGSKTRYTQATAQMEREIERYTDLVHTLRGIPPMYGDSITEAHVMSEKDSVLMATIDSLHSVMDSLNAASAARDTATVAAAADTLLSAPPVTEGEDGEPLYLSGQQLLDREACVKYAEAMVGNLQKLLTAMEEESIYYISVQEKVEKLNTFAQSRYKVLQDNIFRDGDTNYFSVLAHLPTYLSRIKSTFESKYQPLEGHDVGYSEWRGAPVLFMSVFIVFYLAIALAISYAVLRWLLPKKWRTPEFRLKRSMLNNVVGIALFAVIIMVVRSQTSRSFIQMGTGLVINLAWLLEVIFLSLYIRLRGEQMRHAAIVYTPLLLMAFVVILFRIVLIPTLIANLIYPAVLLVFTAWQLFVSGRHASYLPALDKTYAHISSAVMAVTCVVAWVGYTLMAVQIMIWWTFQLAAIMTVTCIYDLMNMYESRRLVFRIKPELREALHKGKNGEKMLETLSKEMRQGKHFGKTWFYDFVNMTLVPVFAVGSVLLSVYQAGGVFEMRDMFVRIFMVNFIDQEGLIQVSLGKLTLVVSLWFVFKYINYAIHSIYHSFRLARIKPGETLNTTMANNVIAILCWGLYIIQAMVMLQVPRSGISIVGAGLATGVGFAMQSILENFFYGISLMTGRLRVGDYIECDGVMGRVDSITYQSTQILTADGCVIAFLNSALFSKNFKNRTRNHLYELTKIPFGVAYGTDVAEVRKHITEALAPICEERGRSGRLLIQSGTPPTVAFSGFGDSSVDLVACLWMLVEEQIGLTGRVKEIIYDTLNKNGIEIPFPQRDVHVRN